MNKQIAKLIIAFLLLSFLFYGGTYKKVYAAKSMITIDDLNWQGQYRFPTGGSGSAGGPGTMSFSSGALAVRYVNGQRRYLVPTFTAGDATRGQTWGDIVEYTDAAASPSTGSITNAPVLVETRRWANWTPAFTATSTWWEGSTGVRIGGIYWDEDQGVLWYTLYGYYSGKNHPLLAAVQLLDTVTTGNYRDLGVSYGPWWYGDNNPSDRTNLYWKAVNYWLIKVPDTQRSVMNNHKYILGGAAGAVGGSGNLGPGFQSVPDLPPLDQAANSILALGKKLADYTSASTQRPPQARRDPNYDVIQFPNHTSVDGGIWSPISGRGYWQMSLDQVNSFIWVDTPSKEGILIFGREVNGYTWYGFNPVSRTPGWTGGPDATDPSRAIGDSNGYGGSQWNGALYAFNPSEVREVAQNLRSPFSDGINPNSLGDWHTKWPNIPMSLGGRMIGSQISNSGYWDPVAQQVIWINEESVGNYYPAMEFFSVSGAVSSTPIIGDINLDHVVNSIDYSILNSKWFTSDTNSDLNKDGIVNAIDFSILNANWFKTW